MSIPIQRAMGLPQLPQTIAGANNDLARYLTELQRALYDWRREYQLILNSSVPIKSAQTGFANAVAVSTSTGEDVRYIDITLSTAVVIAKSFVFLQAPWVDNASAGIYATARLTTTTNLRVSTTIVGLTTMTGRWQVLEFQ